MIPEDKMRTQSGVDSLVDTEVAHNEAQCGESNDFIQKALQEIIVLLKPLSRCTTNIDKMPLPDPDIETAKISQLLQHAYKATANIVRDTTRSVAGGIILPLSIEHKMVLSINQSEVQSSSAVQIQSAIGTTQEAKQASERQTIDLCPDKEDNSARKRKHEPLLAVSSTAKRYRHASHMTIRIGDVKDAFIFEYPHKSLLLWILQCASCGFYPKRNPLINTLSLSAHWDRKSHEKISIQEILEGHLVQVIGGSLSEAREKNRELGPQMLTLFSNNSPFGGIARGPAACQPRRADAPQYVISTFIQLLQKKGQNQPTGLHGGNTPKNQLNQNPRIAVNKKPLVMTEAATPLRQPPNGNSPQPALSAARKHNSDNALMTSVTAQSSGCARSQGRDQTPAYEKAPNTAVYAGFSSGFNSNFNDKLLAPTSANANTNNAICAQRHLDARDCDRERNQGEEYALKDGTKTTARRRSNRIESIYSQLGGRGRDIAYEC